MKKKLLNILSVMAILGTLLGCTQPNLNLGDESTSTGAGTLNLSIAAIAPWLEGYVTASPSGNSRGFLYITSVSVQIDGGTPIVQGLSGASVGVPTHLQPITGVSSGSHTVTVKLFNSVVDGVNPILQAVNVPISVSATGISTVTVTPLPISPITLIAGTPDTPTLSLNGEVWYKMDLTAGQSYLLALTAATSKQLFIFSSDGVYSGNTLASGSGLRFNPTSNTTYYLGIAGTTAGSCTLSLTTDTIKSVDFRPYAANNTISLDFQTSPKDVYFVFTNTNATSSSKPVISPNEGSPVGQWLSTPKSISPELSNEPQSGSPMVTASNQAMAAQLSQTPRGPMVYPVTSRAFNSDVVGTTTFNFNTGTLSTSTKVMTTLRKKVGGVATVQGTRNLEIWVADDCWTGSTKKYTVTQIMVDTFADKFLLTGLDNDIYDWVTNIFGAEWGLQPYGNLIPCDETIHIVIYDIDGDNSDNGGVLGFFWAKDNYTTASVAGSNQKILFALDAVMLASSKDNGTTGAGTGSDLIWSTTDYWPSELISTLSHEFQHMIHFYQKVIVSNTGGLDSQWNEMLSMLTEDLVADKILVNGPRGVAYGDYTPGSSGNMAGRLPMANYFNDAPLNTWLSGSTRTGGNDVLISYSLAYSFGSFLVRNYGGINLLKSIQSNSAVNQDTLTAAILATTGETVTFNNLLQRWAAASIWSDRIDAPQGMRYYTGKQSYSKNGTVYNLGGINLYNYKAGSLVGPWYYDGTTNILPTTLENGTNAYYKAGTGLTGAKSWTVNSLPAGVLLTVVVK